MFSETLIQLVISIILLASIVLLTFAMFKIPIKQNDKQIAVLALILGASNFYMKYILHSNLSFIFLLLTFFVVLTVIRRYPLFYSFIVCFTGIFAGALIDVLLSYIATWTGLSTPDLMQSSFKHFVFFNVAHAMLSLLVTILLVKLRMGFALIIKRFQGKYSLKIYNFVWASVLLIGAFVIQFIALEKEALSVYGLSLAALLIVFLLTILYGWRENKKARYARVQAFNGGTNS